MEPTAAGGGCLTIPSVSFAASSPWLRGAITAEEEQNKESEERDLSLTESDYVLIRMVVGIGKNS